MSYVKDVRILSALEKIYDSDKIPATDYKGFSMLKNEKKSFQLAIEVTEDCELDLSYESSLKNIRIYTVEHIKSDLPMSKKGADNYYRFSESGYYPDLLLPFDGKVNAKKGITVLWFEIDGTFNDAGKHRIDFTIADKTATVQVEVINAELDFKDFELSEEFLALSAVSLALVIFLFWLVLFSTFSVRDLDLSVSLVLLTV